VLLGDCGREAKPELVGATKRALIPKKFGDVEPGDKNRAAAVETPMRIAAVSKTSRSTFERRGTFGCSCALPFG